MMLSKICVCLFVFWVSMAFAAETNVALGAKYTFSAPPKYSHCTGESDLTDLTDSITNPDPKQKMWVQKGCVGWNRPKAPTSITIDLGKQAVFSRITFHTAGNVAGVSWPGLIDAEVSDDGKNYYTMGCLSSIGRGKMPLPDAGYAPHTYDAIFKPVQAQWLRLRIIPAGPYLFCDEIEVFSPASNEPKTVLKPSQLPAVMTDQEFASKSINRVMASSIDFKLKVDADFVNEMIDNSKISQGKKDELQSKLENIVANIPQTFEGVPQEYKAVTPLNNSHREIFALRAELLREEGINKPVFGIVPAYEKVYPLDSVNGKMEIAMPMMNNEYRSVCLNVLNPQKKKVTFTVNANGLPIDFLRVVYLESNQLNTTATALLPIDGTFEVLPGMTTQLFVRFHPVGMKPGLHIGTITLSQNNEITTFRVKLEIAKVAFPHKPSLATGFYDYLCFYNGETKSSGISSSMKDEAIARLKEYRVNAALCTIGSIGLAKKANANEPMDFSTFDQWTKDLPDFDYYGIFCLVTEEWNKFAGKTPGTPAFEEAVSEWAKVWESHLANHKIKPEQVIFYFFDEVRTVNAYTIAQQWSQAFKKGSKRIKTYSNPLKYFKEAQTLIKDIDIISPRVDLLKHFYPLLQVGQEMWTYNCSAGPFNSEPWYFRGQAWEAAKYDAKGSTFWALGDTSGNSYCWNQYLTKSVYYAPFLIDAEHLVATKHMEAFREGTEDYEYLLMLKKKNPALRKQIIEQTLEKRHCNTADEQRIVILEELSK